MQGRCILCTAGAHSARAARRRISLCTRCSGLRCFPRPSVRFPVRHGDHTRGPLLFACHPPRRAQPRGFIWLSRKGRAATRAKLRSARLTRSRQQVPNSPAISRSYLVRSPLRAAASPASHPGRGGWHDACYIARRVPNDAARRPPGYVPRPLCFGQRACQLQQSRPEKVL